MNEEIGNKSSFYKIVKHYLHNHPSIIFTIIYVLMCFLGFAYATTSCLVFDLDYTIISTPLDFLIAFLRMSWALDFLVFMILSTALYLISETLRKRPLFYIFVFLLTLVFIFYPFFYQKSYRKSVIDRPNYILFMKKDEKINSILENPVGPVSIIISTSKHIAVYFSHSNEKTYCINKNSIIAISPVNNNDKKNINSSLYCNFDMLFKSK